jgi:GT2 family glycosyltransferase
LIVFGTAVVDGNLYDRTARPGIDRVREPDSLVLAHQSAGTLFRNYNLIMEMAAKQDDLEALVLLHQDAEIVDPSFCEKVREALSDPDVAVVGCAGALGVRSIAWWEGAVTWASFTHRYTELGGGQFDSYSFVPETTPSFAETGQVDSIDGFIMVLSPWAVHNLAFDENLGKLHGYDFDICCQAREAGKKVVTMDVKMIHHHSLDLISDPETWIEAYVRLAEKWDERLPHAADRDADWRTRALRGEAAAAAAHGSAITHQLRFEALERHLQHLQGSWSWRLTAPLRWLKALFSRG